ncbi:hypothetical protein OIO90_004752 [Microbotryomycetes sp. JL221]|nr:hypothetical protein OIO90_004752 [Microbotryomycetes sp. JL221]
MASLNWTMLSRERKPMPLPHEKFMSPAIHGVVLRLYKLPLGANMSYKPPASDVRKATGTVYLSNKRVMFVSRDQQLQQQSDHNRNDDNALIDTFAVPYTHLYDGRFVQPWFGANYYEASCVAAPGGGLQPSTTYAVTFTFNDSGGFDFYQTVEEMKQRLGADGTSTPQESLPLYTPPSAAQGQSTSQSISTSSGNANDSLGNPIQDRSTRQQPQTDDLLAASVANQAQFEEDTTMTSQLDQRPPSAGVGGPTRESQTRQTPRQHQQVEPNELPPSYVP